MKRSLPHCRLLPAAVFLLAFALARAEAAPSELQARLTPKRVIHEVNVNEFIDQNIEAIKDIASLIDPTNIRDIKHSLTSLIYINLHSGWLQNLAWLQRAGRCMLTYSQKVVTADMTFGWEELVFDYRYKLKLLVGSRQGDLHGQLHDAKINVVLNIDLENYQVALQRLDFIDTGKITIKLEGHILDKIYNLIIKTITSVLKNIVLQTIEATATEMIQLEIDELNESLGHIKNRPWTFVNNVKPKQFLY